MLIGLPTLAFIGGVPGGGEIVLVLVVLLLVFGAKNLPQIARTIGKTMEEFRRATREVTDEIMRAEPDDSAHEDKPALPPAPDGTEPWNPEDDEFSDLDDPYLSGDDGEVSEDPKGNG